MRKRQDCGMRNKDSGSKKRRLLFVLFLFLLLFTITSTVVEAAALDRVKSAWASMRVYVLNAAFWVNALIIFGVLFLLYSMLLSQKIGNDTSQKVIVYILIIIIAMIIGAKIVDGNGVPQYMWHNQQFSKFAQFLIGPTAENRVSSCAGGAAANQVRAVLALEPNPICCGTGSYWTVQKGRPVCRQAILRTNENGSGLPAFIVALILFYILFSAFGDKLGFGSSGSGGGKWFPIFLTVVLAALITNQRLSKNSIIMIGGWVAMVLIGVKMSKSMSGEQQPGHWKRVFAFGLAFAFVELLANMLGASLFGGDYTAADIGVGTILTNILWGMPFGLVYSIFVGDRIFGRIMDRADDRRRREVSQLIDQDNYGRPFARNIPGGGLIPGLRPDRVDDQRANDERIIAELQRLWNMYEQERQRPTPDRVLIDRIYRRITELQDRLWNEERTRGRELEQMRDNLAEARREGEPPEAGPPRRPPL